MAKLERQSKVSTLLVTEYDFLEEEADEAVEESLSNQPDLWDDEDVDDETVAETIARTA